eukprot:356034-Chlamydomonas_euryale.AAC.12
MDTWVSGKEGRTERGVEGLAHTFYLGGMQAQANQSGLCQLAHLAGGRTRPEGVGSAVAGRLATAAAMAAAGSWAGARGGSATAASAALVARLGRAGLRAGRQVGGRAQSARCACTAGVLGIGAAHAQLALCAFWHSERTGSRLGLGTVPAQRASKVSEAHTC